ncbi:MAG TPA: hypothetical protein VKU00_16745 [Chthonomonadaceae bacterium]|nr:hypothetical protein [Chthonomonadaceae bacterium]
MDYTRKVDLLLWVGLLLVLCQPIVSASPEQEGESMLCQAKAVAESVTGGSIAQRGHGIPVEPPQELTRRILAFCSEEGSRP